MKSIIHKHTPKDEIFLIFALAGSLAEFMERADSQRVPEPIKHSSAGCLLACGVHLHFNADGCDAPYLRYRMTLCKLKGLMSHSRGPLTVPSRSNQGSRLTHGHVRSQVCCAVYGLLVRHLLTVKDRSTAWDAAVSSANQIYAEEARFGKPYQVELRRIIEFSNYEGSGYVVDCLCSRNKLSALSQRLVHIMGHKTWMQLCVLASSCSWDSPLQNMPFRAVQVVSEALEIAEQEPLAQGNESQFSDDAFLHFQHVCAFFGFTAAGSACDILDLHCRPKTMRLKRVEPICPFRSTGSTERAVPALAEFL